MRTNQAVVSIGDSWLGTVLLDTYSPKAEVSDTEDTHYMGSHGAAASHIEQRFCFDAVPQRLIA